MRSILTNFKRCLLGSLNLPTGKQTMKLWKKSSQNFVRTSLCATLLLGAGMAHAEPNDALEQLIKQRQMNAATQNSNSPSQEFEKLIRSKTDNRINYNFVQNGRNNTTSAAQVANTTTAASANTTATKKTGKAMTAAQALSMFRPRPAVSSSATNSSDANALISSAMGFIGVAYRFGGTTPRGFDCSGFMQYVFRKTFAVNIPRTAAAQATVGSHVSRSNLQPGDMVFFKTAGPRRISHVGMYVGNNRFIHAPRTGKTIEVTSLGNKYWSSKYATARRVKRQSA